MHPGIKHTILALVLIILPAAAGIASAAERGLVEKQKIFIRSLFAQKRYFDVITETRRLMAFDPDAANGPDYAYFININFFMGKQYRSVVAGVSSLPGRRDYRNCVLLSQAYLKLGMNERGLDEVARLRYDGMAPQQRYPLLARKAEAYLDCGLYNELADELRSAEESVPDPGRVRMFRTEVDEYRRVRQKSVPLAVALSVLIPGAGQIYAGKWPLGVISFVGVAALAGGAYALYRHGNRDLAYTFIAFSSVFYLGNIYGAFNAAESANEDLRRGINGSLKQKFIPAFDPAAEAREIRALQ